MTGSQRSNLDYLLENILDPSAVVAREYQMIVLELQSGRTINGIITVETASSVTLQRAENQTDVVLRQDIEEIQSTGQSLMPEGLEKDLPPQAMADLIAYLTKAK